MCLLPFLGYDMRPNQAAFIAYKAHKFDVTAPEKGLMGRFCTFIVLVVELFDPIDV